MIAQIFLGSVLISLTILIEAAFIGGAVAVLRRIGSRLSEGHRTAKLIVTTTAMTLWMLGALTFAVWIWAGAFLAIGEFEALEPALYFSFVAFTTLGFGDMLLSEEWRLLSGFIAANGLILFSLTTAFLLSAIRGIQGNGGD